MRDLRKAQELVTLFIQRLKDYQLDPKDETLEQLKKINVDYKKANGGGDLFKVIGNDQETPPD